MDNIPVPGRYPAPIRSNYRWHVARAPLQWVHLIALLAGTLSAFGFLTSVNHPNLAFHDIMNIKNMWPHSLGFVDHGLVIALVGLGHMPCDSLHTPLAWRMVGHRRWKFHLFFQSICDAAKGTGTSRWGLPAAALIWRLRTWVAFREISWLLPLPPHVPCHTWGAFLTEFNAIAMRSTLIKYSYSQMQTSSFLQSEPCVNVLLLCISS